MQDEGLRSAYIRRETTRIDGIAACLHSVRLQLTLRKCKVFPRSSKEDGEVSLIILPLLLMADGLSKRVHITKIELSGD